MVRSVARSVGVSAVDRCSFEADRFVARSPVWWGMEPGLWRVSELVLDVGESPSGCSRVSGGRGGGGGGRGRYRPTLCGRVPEPSRRGGEDEEPRRALCSLDCRR